MAQNYSELIFLVPWFVLLGIAATMLVHGWMIINEYGGYHENPKIPLKKGHPEMKDYKQGEGLLVVNFDKLPEDDYSELQQRINKLKMDELFEEPSTYEDEEDE